MASQGRQGEACRLRLDVRVEDGGHARSACASAKLGGFRQPFIVLPLRNCVIPADTFLLVTQHVVLSRDALKALREEGVGERTLLYGGVAMNPRSHLRLVYEANPLAFITEQVCQLALSPCLTRTRFGRV